MVLNTSWHSLQKTAAVLPVSFRFGMNDGQVMMQLQPDTSTSGWQSPDSNKDFVSPTVFL